jgi:NosR/NirI family nitrous oxide reductase transcriptional regulator
VQAFAVGCGAQALDADGRIDHRECLHCLDCMILYTDTKGCPPLAKERKRREKDGLEITPIGANGYFIPIHPATVEDQISPKAKNGVDPRMPTDRTLPAHKRDVGLLAWLWLELRDHLWPWSREGWNSQRALQIAGLALAIAVTLAWVQGALGHLSSGAIIGWWFGWSVYEVMIRLSGRRYVKDGPWWRDQYRVAGVMDMMSYVGFKNLMIGAALFLLFKALGWLIA